MARADTIELLTSLVDNLAPLGAMTPGRPLRASEWNGLVEAMRTMARLAVSRERTTADYLDERYAPLDHEHIAQATIEWFEPKTRALLEENVSGSVEQRAGLKSARDEIASLGESVEALRRQLADLRADVDGIRDADAARIRDIDRVSARVETLRNVETRVTDLDLRLESMGADVQAVLEFRDQLRDETGAPLDVAKLGARVTELEGLRENLLTANGEVVNIREIESAIARLEDNVLTTATLDAAVLARLQDEATIAQTGLVETVSGLVETSLADRFASLEATTTTIQSDVTGLQATIASDAERIDQQATRITNAEAQLAQVAALSGRVDVQQGVLVSLDARVSAVQTATAGLGAMSAQITELQADVAGIDALQADVTAIGDRVSAVELNTATIDGLVTTAQATATRVGAIEEVLPGLRAAATLATGHDAALGDLQGRVQAAEAELANAGDVAARLNTLDGQVGAVTTAHAGTSGRVDQLAQRVFVIDGLSSRLSDVEMVVAEHRQTFFQLDERFLKSEDSLRTITVSYDERLTSLERVVFEGRTLDRIQLLESSMTTTVLPSVNTFESQMKTMDTRVRKLETRTPIDR
jgi:predicted  nucleic acid-binding Zn-ribbon protein